jgi:hypothetical protein
VEQREKKLCRKRRNSVAQINHTAADKKPGVVQGRGGVVGMASLGLSCRRKLRRGSL